MDLNMSMMKALENSKEPQDLGDLGFILTVLRDNTDDDFVHEVLDNLIKNSK